jgi:hypothetical protein
LVSGEDSPLATAGIQRSLNSITEALLTPLIHIQAALEHWCMLSTTSVRVGSICLVIGLPIAVMAAEDGVTGNLETVRYLLRAAEAHEHAAAQSRGRMRAIAVWSDGKENAAQPHRNVKSIIDCVWDETHSLRTVAEFDSELERQSRAAGKQKDIGPLRVQYRLLLTPDRAIHVFDGTAEAKKSHVSTFPRHSMPGVKLQWLVLPNEDAWKYAFQIEVSRVLKGFLEPPVDFDPRPTREIIESKNQVTLRVRSPEGWEVRYIFSHEWDGRLVEYHSVPGGPLITQKHNGKMTWKRDPHGEVFLQQHTYEESVPSAPEWGTSKRTLMVEDYNSDPAIDPSEFTLAGLKLPDETPLNTFGNDISAPIAKGTVGGKPLIPEQGNELESLVEQLKNRGFARPERIRSR